MTKAAWVLALLAVSACDKTVATPPGVLLDVPTFTKMSVTSWTVGAPKGPATKVSKKFHYSADFGPDVRFSVSFEHGPSELVDAKPKAAPPPPVQTPRAIHIELLENKGWAITAKCDDDLKVPLAVNPDGSAAYPTSVFASCEVVMKRKNGDITAVAYLDVNGDGKLEARVGADDEHIKEE